MTQPSFVPLTRADQVRPAQNLQVPHGWEGDRPADVRGFVRIGGRGRGTPGPDQGYAIHLARRFEGRLRLGPDEHEEDVLAGAALLAARRSALFGRAPCIHDLTVALRLFGLLDEPGAPAVSEPARTARAPLFRSVAHEYVAQRRLIDAVPEAALRSTPDQAAGRGAEGWWTTPADTAPSGVTP
jgi:hypothetical protein